MKEKEHEAAAVTEANVEVIAVEARRGHSLWVDELEEVGEVRGTEPEWKKEKEKRATKRK